jgi:SAP domain
MIRTATYIGTATQARRATEESVEALENGAASFAEQLDNVKLPTVDLTESVTRYFEFVQKAVELNRDLTTAWTELVTSLSGSVGQLVTPTADEAEGEPGGIAYLLVKQTKKLEQVAKDQANTVEQVKRNQADRIAHIERIEQTLARESYQGLTNAELSDLLTERGLPKTGNLHDLIERLVSADSE